MTQKVKKIRYAVFTGNADYCRIWAERNVTADDAYVSFGLPRVNAFLQKINILHNSRTVNDIIKLPLRSLWYDKYLDTENIDLSECKCFLFLESCRLSTDRDFIKYLREKYKETEFIFTYTNPVNSYSHCMLEDMKKLYDKIIVFEKLNIIDNTKVFYYEINTDQFFYGDVNITSDIFFVGENKGRYDFLINLFEYLRKNGVVCDFTILKVPFFKRKFRREINYTKRLPYKEVIKRFCRSNCILEAVQSNQQGRTMRSTEAISYNKKLVSNNKYNDMTIFNKKSYMFIEKPEDANISFIKERPQGKLFNVENKQGGIINLLEKIMSGIL